MNIALLTCADFPDLIATEQQLIPELASHDITATAQIWDDPTVNWTYFDYLIFRNTWDYYEKESAFNNWLSEIKRLGIKTLNALEVIQQNKHKFYLRDLERQGIPIIPTIFISKTTSLDLAQLIPAHWPQAVIKPAFSGGSYQTKVFEATDIDQINETYKIIAAEKELLLQQFMPEIQTLGETSLIFFNKTFSHAINKKPAAGDFRVQVQFGGKYTLIHPEPGLIAKAQHVISTFRDPLLYARVDGIAIGDEFRLMEVECIEPDLYFNLSEGSQQRFVNAILALISK
jgi:glutathione synthase/RimK-type ligase-like ATP-grasp enzyme